VDLREIIREMREVVQGFNPPADAGALAKLEGLAADIPADVVHLYRDHDGLDAIPLANGSMFAARLMPVEQAMKTQIAMNSIADLPKCGSVLWLWTDDNSNYCGVYTDGPLAGWLTVFDHEEPMLVPAFRSVASFMEALLNEAMKEEEDDPAIDVPYVPRELPETSVDCAHYEGDKLLAERFSQLYADEQDGELRRLYAFCAICLTPFQDTEKVLRFLEMDDMWIPEAAVNLLGVRRWERGVPQLERLAREGRMNGDSAAMRHLLRMGTAESQDAIARLHKLLKGQKLQLLEQWSRGSLPPRWP
jgi:hypothetical protein